MKSSDMADGNICVHIHNRMASWRANVHRLRASSSEKEQMSPQSGDAGEFGGRAAIIRLPRGGRAKGRRGNEGPNQMSQEIAIAEYRYEDIYPSFKAGTDEKEITGALNGRFLRGLLRRSLIPSRPLKVADVGCGPCDTILKYLTGLDFAPGFRIRATDFSV